MKKRIDILYLIIGLVILLIVLIASMFVTPTGKEVREKMLEVFGGSDLIEIDPESNKHVWERTAYKDCVSEKTECDLNVGDENLAFKLRIEEIEKEKVVVLYINNIKFNFSESLYGNVHDYNVNKVDKINDYFYVVRLDNLEKGNSVLTIINKYGKTMFEVNSISKFKKITEYEVNDNELIVISIVEHKANELLTLCKDYKDDDIIISVESITFNDLDYNTPVEVSNDTLKSVIKTNYGLDSCKEGKEKYPDYKVK